MGISCSLPGEFCQALDCDADRSYYIDQNEMKFGPTAFSPHLRGAKATPSLLRTSSRSTASTSTSSKWPGRRLSPESVTWTDGLGKRTAAGRWQLTPKASSFAGAALDVGRSLHSNAATSLWHA
mmetsp:Transcript_32417/g.61047  ORF Transcript_32417/g.61047 Transcript_32417/m.61047 type:complete len:124 (-) Transcript_32417:115-486(-)